MRWVWKLLFKRGAFFMQGDEKVARKTCRPRNGIGERLTTEEIEKLMRHASYERGANGRMRSRGGRVVVIR